VVGPGGDHDPGLRGCQGPGQGEGEHPLLWVKGPQVCSTGLHTWKPLFSSRYGPGSRGHLSWEAQEHYRTSTGHVCYSTVLYCIVLRGEHI